MGCTSSRDANTAIDPVIPFNPLLLDTIISPPPPTEGAALGNSTPLLDLVDPDTLNSAMAQQQAAVTEMGVASFSPYIRKRPPRLPHAGRPSAPLPPPMASPENPAAEVMNISVTPSESTSLPRRAASEETTPRNGPASSFTVSLSRDPRGEATPSTSLTRDPRDHRHGLAAMSFMSSLARDPRGDVTPLMSLTRDPRDQASPGVSLTKFPLDGAHFKRSVTRDPREPVIADESASFAPLIRPARAQPHRSTSPTTFATAAPLL